MAVSTRATGSAEGNEDALNTKPPPSVGPGVAVCVHRLKKRKDYSWLTQHLHMLQDNSQNEV